MDGGTNLRIFANMQRIKRKTLERLKNEEKKFLEDQELQNNKQKENLFSFGKICVKSPS